MTSSPCKRNAREMSRAWRAFNRPAEMLNVEAEDVLLYQVDL